jgi:hypothetical protein
MRWRVSSPRTRTRTCFQCQPCTHGSTETFRPDRLLETIKKKEKNEEVQKFQILCRERFQCAAFGRKLKHEDPFDPSLSFPYMSGDLYEFFKQVKRREEWLERTKVLYGPFRAAGKKTNEVDAETRQAQSRKSLTDMVKHIHRVLREDWPEQDFTVAATLDDFIAVVFDLATVDSLRALLGYMNVFERSHLICRKYLLSKVKNAWGHSSAVEQHKVWFLLRPVWVNRRVPCSLFESPAPTTSSRGGTLSATASRSTSRGALSLHSNSHSGFHRTGEGRVVPGQIPISVHR